MIICTYLYPGPKKKVKVVRILNLIPEEEGSANIHFFHIYISLWSRPKHQGIIYMYLHPCGVEPKHQGTIFTYPCGVKPKRQGNYTYLHPCGVEPKHQGIIFTYPCGVKPKRQGNFTLFISLWS